jgi:energy-coupling factor transport system permease protein
MLHTATLILCWTAISVLLQRIEGPPLAAIAAGALAATAGLGAFRRLISMLRRSRWLLTAVVILHLVPAIMSETGWRTEPLVAGAVAGIEQALRLAVLLALLAILLQQRTREDLVAGIYSLMAPFAWVGMDRGRFAARLCLTLAYFEQPRPPGPQRNMAAALTEVDRTPGAADSVIVLPAERLGTTDQLAIAVIGLAMGVALL